MTQSRAFDLLVMPTNYEARNEAWKQLTESNGLFQGLYAAMAGDMVDKAADLLTEWYEIYIQYDNASLREWEIAHAMLTCTQIATLNATNAEHLTKLIHQVDPQTEVPDAAVYQDKQNWRSVVRSCLEHLSWPQQTSAIWAWDIICTMWDSPCLIAQSQDIAVLLVVGNDGVTATLTIELLADEGSGLFYPDPATMSFVTRGETFTQSERNAVAYVRSMGLWGDDSKSDIRWKVTRRDGKSLTSLQGGSLGAAFALGLAKTQVSS